ncbi:MAG: FAD-dependent oxidoreductase, partial [Actinobacteria bacterium]|nr:FAD-dependent oxidoreductase [Actinomycetota bacterium]
MGDVRDLLVVGGGSGGIAAAQSAKFRGATVAIVQDGPIGGDCTWTGCIPSKALLAAASRDEPFDVAMASVQAAIGAIAAAEDAEMLREEGIEVVEGRGTLVGRTGGALLGVEVGGVTHRAKSIIVCPGSKPLIPPIGGLADVAYLTNETIFSLSEQPEHLLVVGGGPIGCEMAEAFSSLGSVVTIIEGDLRLMPRDDADAAAVIDRSLGRRGVGIRTGVFVSEVAATDLGVAATLSDGSSIESSHVLIATGRAPSHAEMGLEAAGVELTDRGWINVDEHLQTSIKGVYAVGD